MEESDPPGADQTATDPPGDEPLGDEPPGGEPPVVDPRVAAHYDDLAEHWAAIVDAPARQELLWPTIDDMLPDVAGRRVLDVGCGAGVFAATLAERGAEVVGVDVSEAMVAEARERVPRGTFRQADLGDGLPQVADGSVDVVVCLHVLSHLPDLETPLDAFARVLRPGGTLVLSTHNPVQDYVVVREGEAPAPGDLADLEPTVEAAAAGVPTYGDTERFDIVWGEGATANRGTYYRRSFEALCSPLLDAGFTIDDVVEPTPDEAFSEAHPDLAADLETHAPGSICLRATLDGT